MKIALFSDTYIPDINGVATSTNILRNKLVNLGHDVLVVTSELPSDTTYDESLDDQVLRVPGLEIQALYGYRACNIFSFKGMKEIKRFNPEVIHVQTEFGIGIFGRIAAEYLDIPVVYTYHTMWTDYSHYINPINSETVDTVVKKVITKISKFYGNSCQGLIVPSNKTKDALIHYGLKQKNIYTIPTGLELERFSVNNKNNELCQSLIEKYHLQNHFVLTFLGRIAPEKSITVIIDALKKVVAINDNIRFLIVGGGPQLEELKEYVKNDHIESYVIFTGPQSGEMVPAHYHISNMFISASLSETQGLTYIEAMASSIPVIARYDDQLEDVIDDGKNGFFFKNEDELPKLILDAMEMDLDVLKENNDDQSMAAKAIESAQINVNNHEVTVTLKLKEMTIYGQTASVDKMEYQLKDGTYQEATIIEEENGHPTKVQFKLDQNVKLTNVKFYYGRSNRGATARLSLDLDHLTKVIPSRFNQDGTYSVDVALWNATSDKASMAATALDSKAKIIVKDGKATMYISTKEMSFGTIKASLQEFYIGSAQEDYKNHSATIIEKDTQGNPTLWSFELPHEDEYINVMMNPHVAMMGNMDLEARIKVDYSTLTYISDKTELETNTKKEDPKENNQNQASNTATENKTETTKDSQQESQAVKTGDQAPITMMSVLGMISLFMFVVLQKKYEA